MQQNEVPGGQTHIRCFVVQELLIGVQAEKEAETSRIRMQQLLQEREAEQQRDTIQNEMHLNKQKAFADAEHYRCCSFFLQGRSAYRQSPVWQRQ